MPQRPHPWKKEPAFVSTPLHPIFARLLPDATVLRLEACEIDDTTAQITLRVHVAAEKAPISRVKVPPCQLPDSDT